MLDYYVLRMKGGLQNTLKIQPPVIAFFSPCPEQPFVIVAADQTGTGQRK